MLDLTIVETAQNSIPKSLTADRHKALLQMQKMNPFCKFISRWLSNGKSQKHETNLFTHIKGLLYKQVMDINQKIYGTHHTQSLEVYSTSRGT